MRCSEGASEEGDYRDEGRGVGEGLGDGQAGSGEAEDYGVAFVEKVS